MNNGNLIHFAILSCTAYELAGETRLSCASDSTRIVRIMLEQFHRPRTTSVELVMTRRQIQSYSAENETQKGRDVNNKHEFPWCFVSSFPKNKGYVE